MTNGIGRLEFFGEIQQMVAEDDNAVDNSILTPTQWQGGNRHKFDEWSIAHQK